MALAVAAHIPEGASASNSRIVPRRKEFVALLREAVVEARARVMNWPDEGDSAVSCATVGGTSWLGRVGETGWLVEEGNEVPEVADVMTAA